MRSGGDTKLSSWKEQEVGESCVIIHFGRESLSRSILGKIYNRVEGFARMGEGMVIEMKKEGWRKKAYFAEQRGW